MSVRTLAETFFLLMCMVVEGLNLIRQTVWKQALDPILAAVLDRLLIIPAFESEHMSTFVPCSGQQC